MKTYPTITVKNGLRNSRIAAVLTKPTDQYVSRVLERNDHGCLCVVYDGDEAICIADVCPEDIDELLPTPLKEKR